MIYCVNNFREILQKKYENKKLVLNIDEQIHELAKPVTSENAEKNALLKQLLDVS